MPAIFEYGLTVAHEAIDQQGHANNLEYVRWMQQAAIAHSAAQGWPLERYQRHGSGWVVRSHRIEYLQPAFEGDQLKVLTWVADFRKVRSLRRYKVLRPADDAIVARAETDWTYVSLQHRVPRRVPTELIEAFVLVGKDDEP